MNDVFAKGRALQQAKQALAPQQIPGGAPQAMPGPGLDKMQNSATAVPLAKHFGIDQNSLDKNPAIARAQVIQHLHQSLGPNFMQHPGVKDLLANFQSGIGGTQPTAGAISGQNVTQAKNLKAFLG